MADGAAQTLDAPPEAAPEAADVATQARSAAVRTVSSLPSLDSAKAMSAAARTSTSLPSMASAADRSHWGASTAALPPSGPEGPGRAPDVRLLSFLCLVGCLEGADIVLLPCSFLALQVDLGLSLNHLACMSMVQALAGNLAAPLWGVLADRGTLRRKTIIALGCVAQGLITVILSGVDAMWLMVALRALNGIMLASLRPIASGIVADVTSDTNRGKVYGGMNIAMNTGLMLGTLIGTNLARKRIWGLQGWRVAFIIVGIASVLVGALAWLFMREPPRCVSEAAARRRGWAAVKAELRELLRYFRMPSFCVLILQGCFGTVPWNALGYKMLFFQLGGISDFQASLIDSFAQVAGSGGALLGGAIGDGMTRLSKSHGRPITAQISVLAGIPIAWLIFMAQPPEGHAFTYYLVLMIVLGLTATWCGNGVNLPILSEIVEGDRRATIMAWEGALESSCSAIFGNAMVGLLAQNLFGYDLSTAKPDNMETHPANIQALGTALMLVSFFPWVLCFVCYSLLHWSYPRDLMRVKIRKAKALQSRNDMSLEAAPKADDAL